MLAFGKLDEDYGFIAMELLGQNSLEILRKLEQTRHHTTSRVTNQSVSERCYGFPLAAIVAIAVKLVPTKYFELWYRSTV